MAQVLAGLARLHLTSGLPSAHLPLMAVATVEG